MSNIADRIAAKITRAKQHIVDLELALRAFHDTSPYAIGFDEHTHPGKRVYHVTKADFVPDSVTTIAADVIQNLRSPLDQIAHQLVLAACGGTMPPSVQIHYPICGSAAYYPSARGTIAKHVRREVIDAIDATEPYQGGKGHGLWQLNKLNNPNKHHLLIGAGSFLDSVDVTSDIPVIIDPSIPKDWKFEFSVIAKPANKLMALKVGDILRVEPIETKVDPNRKFTFSVSFNAPGVIEGEPVLKTIQDMTNLVDDIVTQLGRFLT